MPWWGNPFLGTKNRYETPGVLPRASNGLQPRGSRFLGNPLSTFTSHHWFYTHLYPLFYNEFDLQSHSWNPSKSMLGCLQRFGGSFSTFSKRNELPMKKERVCFYYIHPPAWENEKKTCPPSKRAMSEKREGESSFQSANPNPNRWGFETRELPSIMLEDLGAWLQKSARPTSCVLMFFCVFSFNLKGPGTRVFLGGDWRWMVFD